MTYEAVLDRLNQIEKKVDALNKCSISTVQMAKKVYAGLEDVKQVTGNFRAEIGKFHTTAATVTGDLKQVDRAITSMHERIEETCSVLETEMSRLMNSMVEEQEKNLGIIAKQFLSKLDPAREENPINKIYATVIGMRNLIVALTLLNLMLLIIQMVT